MSIKQHGFREYDQSTRQPHPLYGQTGTVDLVRGNEADTHRQGTLGNARTIGAVTTQVGDNCLGLAANAHGQEVYIIPQTPWKTQ